MIEGLPDLHRIEGLCSSCQFGKLHRKPYVSEGVTRAKCKLELVHSDLCGPMSTPALNQSLYFLLLIDDLTRMTWVYFLSNKSQTFDMFKSFKAMAENESDCRLKKLRTRK